MECLFGLVFILRIQSPSALMIKQDEKSMLQTERTITMVAYQITHPEQLGIIGSVELLDIFLIIMEKVHFTGLRKNRVASFLNVFNVNVQRCLILW